MTTETASIKEIQPPDNDEIKRMVAKVKDDLYDMRISVIRAKQVIVKVLKTLNEGK